MGNRYSEDQLMHMLLDNFHRIGKYTANIARQQAELRGEEKSRAAGDLYNRRTERTPRKCFRCVSEDHLIAKCLMPQIRRGLYGRRMQDGLRLCQSDSAIITTTTNSSSGMEVSSSNSAETCRECSMPCQRANQRSSSP